MKFASVLIAMLTLFLLFFFRIPSAQATDIWGNTMLWEFDAQTATLTISGSGEIEAGDYNCPWECFQKDIKKIVIQEGVTGIGYNGFSDSVNLEEVVMPQSVKSIGNYAFYDCRRLTGIDLTHVTYLGDYAFENCSGLISITIPEGISTIGSATFRGCSNLSVLNLHDGITEIGYSAFEGCYTLTSLRMPSRLKTLYSYAFSHCSNLKEIQLNEGLEILDRGSFSYCSSLEAIILPDSVQEVRPDCFLNCTALRSIHFGSGLSKFSSLALQNCINLTTFTINHNNPHMTVYQNALYSIEPKELVAIAPSYTGEHIIPDGTISIHSAACSGAKLTSVTIPGSVKTICQQVFSDCADLKTVILKEGIEVIDTYAFSRSGITEITFPSTIKTINPLAFLWCQDLKKITFVGLPPQTNKSFSQVSATVYYPGYMDEWKNAHMKRDEYYLTYVPDCMGQHDLRWAANKAPTCTKPGLISEKWCIVCRQNVEQAKEIPATGHNYGNWTEIQAPTTDREGLVQRVCSGCGAKEQKSLSKLPSSQPPITEPPATNPTMPDNSAPTVTAPTPPTEATPSEDSGLFPWLPVVAIAITSIIIGLAASFLIFAYKKRKNK